MLWITKKNFHPYYCFHLCLQCRIHFSDYSKLELTIDDKYRDLIFYPFRTLCWGKTDYRHKKSLK